MKTALVTGSASGLGKSMVIKLANKGYNVIINYRNSRSKADELAEFIENKYKIKALTVQADVSKSQDCEVLFNTILRNFSSLDVLINNAGPYINQRKKLIDYDVEEWNYIINGNINSVFYLSKLVIPEMRKKQWGRIINFGFEQAETSAGWMYRSAFAAAKVGLVSLTKTLSLEEAENGITVNMISPGDIIGSWKEASISEAKGSLEFNTPVGRYGTGEDIARVVSFLCDEHSDLITGSIIPVTGGKDVLNKYKTEE